jgi:glycosyltransferase involved in cell wall biosynthesis
LLYFTASYRPGSMAVPVHAEQVRALAARGYPGAIVTLARAHEQRASIAAVPDGDLPVYRVAISRGRLDRLANRLSRRRYAYTFLLTAARYLRPWLRARLEAAPDAILQVEMAYPMGALVRRALGGRPARAVVTLHGGDIMEVAGDAYGYARTPAVREELRRVFAWAAAVRAMSPTLARRAIELGCPPEKIVTIPLNVSEAFYPVAPLETVRAAAHGAVRAELGLPPDARLLLAAGRVLPIKGFDVLIAALPAVLARQPATHLVLYGPDRGGTVEALRAQVAALGLGARVHFLGTLPFEGQGRFLAAADLAVIPSLLDGFNRFCVEAGAHGTPAIVSTGAGIAEWVRERGAGRVVPPRDPGALAAAIAGLLDDPAAWQAAAAAAARLAEDCRTGRVADALAALYARLPEAGG